MQSLNGEDLSRTPLLICSFGGGQGGFSYHYRFVRIIRTEGAVIEATGFATPPGRLSPRDLLCVHEDTLYHFLTNSDKATKQHVDMIRELILKDEVVLAVRRHQNVIGRPEYVLMIPRQKIMSCGHWHYVGAPVRESFS